MNVVMDFVLNHCADSSRMGFHKAKMERKNTKDYFIFSKTEPCPMSLKENARNFSDTAPVEILLDRRTKEWGNDALPQLSMDLNYKIQMFW